MLRITNVSEAPISYTSWTGPDMGVLLRVEKGAFYNLIPLPKQQPKSISPNETITDTLMFELPPALKNLELDLPFGRTDQSYRFRIPFTQIDRPVAVVAIAAPPPKAPERAAPAPPSPPAAAPPPYDSEKDPKIIAAVRREYDLGTKEIFGKSLGKATNEAVRYRKLKGKELLQKIADKHELELDQVDRILGRN